MSEPKPVDAPLTFENDHPVVEGGQLSIRSFSKVEQTVHMGFRVMQFVEVQQELESWLEELEEEDEG